jgi:hypothetical protein
MALPRPHGSLNFTSTVSVSSPEMDSSRSTTCWRRADNFKTVF